MCNSIRELHNRERRGGGWNFGRGLRRKRKALERGNAASGRPCERRIDFHDGWACGRQTLWACGRRPSGIAGPVAVITLGLWPTSSMLVFVSGFFYEGQRKGFERVT